MIGYVDTLQFIDSMTGHLAWPLAAVALGVTFRRSVAQLLRRVRRLKWRDAEAELAELAEATEDVQEAIEEVVKPLPEDESERTATYRARIERLVHDAAEWGKRIGSGQLGPVNRKLSIKWDDEDQPHLIAREPEYERLAELVAYFEERDEARRRRDEAIRRQNRSHRI